MGLITKTMQRGAKSDNPDVAAAAKEALEKRAQRPSAARRLFGGVGDIAGKYVGPAVSFINPGIGAGITALGRTAGKLNDPGGLSGTKVFKEIGLPTALTYGVGKGAEMLSGAGGADPLSPKLAPIGDTIRTGTGHTLPIGGGGAAASSDILATLGKFGKGALDFLGSDAGRNVLDAGLGAAELYGRHQDRKNQSKFLGGLLDTQRAALAEAERLFAERQPLRDASANTLTATLNKPTDIFRSRGKPAGFTG